MDNFNIFFDDNRNNELEDSIKYCALSIDKHIPFQTKILATIMLCERHDIRFFHTILEEAKKIPDIFWNVAIKNMEEWIVQQ